MSEDFLTRWSRRKRDALDDEQAKAAPGNHDAIPANAVPENTTPVEGSKRATPPEPVFDLKSLPPIESITAATDIRPFLAPAVPLEIARAALRRAWSADPRIRNFVGLADYDWDYHTPGSAAGFGPLEMTDELRRMVARILGDMVETNISEGPREPTASAECVEESPSGAEAKHVASGDSVQPAPELPVDCTESVTTAAALQHATPQGKPPPTRRGHGRALPK
jgi:hypothetical protein